MLIVDPSNRSVRWLRRNGLRYSDVERSMVVATGAQELIQAIDWPELTG